MQNSEGFREPLSGQAEPSPKEEVSPAFHCPDCGGQLAYIRSVLPFRRAFLDTG